MKRVLFAILSGLMLLVAVILIRTLCFTTRQFQVDAPIEVALNREGKSHVPEYSPPHRSARPLDLLP